MFLITETNRALIVALNTIDVSLQEVEMPPLIRIMTLQSKQDHIKVH